MDTTTTTLRGEAIERLATELQEADPDLPRLTAVVMASDRISMEHATALLRAGETSFKSCAIMVGSFARIGWMLDMADAGLIPRADVLRLLPKYWPGADPDDTDPRFLAAWMEAWQANGRRMLLDGPPPPEQNRGVEGEGRKLTVYRGQSANRRPGISWTLDEAVARRFAEGAGLRVRGGVAEPVVYRASVARRQVLAYLTARGESEVIANPFQMRSVET